MTIQDILIKQGIWKAEQPKVSEVPDEQEKGLCVYSDGIGAYPKVMFNGQVIPGIYHLVYKQGLGVGKLYFRAYASRVSLKDVAGLLKFTFTDNSGKVVAEASNDTQA